MDPTQNPLLSADAPIIPAVVPEVVAPPIEQQVVSADPPSSGNKKYLMFAGIGFGVLLLLVGIYLALAKYVLLTWPFAVEVVPQPVVQQPVVVSPSPMDATATWKEYKIKTIGLTFKLNPKLEQYGEPKENISGGESGTMLCFTPRSHCVYGDEPLSYVIGGMSKDYSEMGRSGVVYDFTGYTFKEGKSDVFSEEVIKELTNKNGVKVLVLSGKIEDGPDDFTEGDLLGLINIDHPLYKGVAFKIDKSLKITQQEFEQMLNTIKLD